MTIRTSQFSPKSNHNFCAKYYKAECSSSIVYGPAACLVKITPLLIFTRLFAPYKTVVIFTYSTMLNVFLFYIIILFTKIFICNHISGFWDFNIKSKCLNKPALFPADTIMSVLTNFVILVIPLPLFPTPNLLL